MAEKNATLQKVTTSDNTVQKRKNTTTNTSTKVLKPSERKYNHYENKSLNHSELNKENEMGQQSTKPLNPHLHLSTDELQVPQEEVNQAQTQGDKDEDYLEYQQNGHQPIPNQLNKTYQYMYVINTGYYYRYDKTTELSESYN